MVLFTLEQLKTNIQTLFVCRIFKNCSSHKRTQIFFNLTTKLPTFRSVNAWHSARGHMRAPLLSHSEPTRRSHLWHMTGTSVPRYRYTSASTVVCHSPVRQAQSCYKAGTHVSFLVCTNVNGTHLTYKSILLNRFAQKEIEFSSLGSCADDSKRASRFTVGTCGQDGQISAPTFM